MTGKGKKIYAIFIIIILLVVSVLNIPAIVKAGSSMQKSEVTELSENVKALEEQYNVLSQEEEEKRSQLNSLQAQLAEKEEIYLKKEEESIALRENSEAILLDYSDIIYSYQMFHQPLEIPLYMYDFKFANEASIGSNVTGAVTDTLMGGSFLGSIFSQQIEDNVVKDDISVMQAMCDFNKTMERYIDDHAAVVNEGLIERDILDYCVRIAQPYDELEDTLKYKSYVEKMLSGRLMDGELQPDKLQNIEEIVPLYAAAELLASGYLAAVQDDFGYNEWSDFSSKCYDVMWDQYDFDEMDMMLANAYRENDFSLHNTYMNLLEKTCLSGAAMTGIHYDITSVFVQGDGDQSIYSYYRENDDGDKVIFYIRIRDFHEDLKMSFCYDHNGNISVVSDKMNGKNYYYSGTLFLNEGGQEQGDAIWEYAQWLKDVCEAEQEVDKNTFIAMRDAIADGE